MVGTARVILWDRDIGAVTWVSDRVLGVFQYTPKFVNSGFEIAPLAMPLAETPYEFPSLSSETFQGLPGLLADSLPDKFGNTLIDTWLASKGRQPGSFTPVERLCYIGTRGMGALEFKPLIEDVVGNDSIIEIGALVSLVSRVLDDRVELEGKLLGINDEKALIDILRVSASAGGARAKALIAWNHHTGEFRSGQIQARQDFSHWLIKFDGVSGSKDHQILDPQGYGRIEYAYYLMAQAAGIEMQECRLFEEGGRAHFMTRRFDRTSGGGKLHMQSLGAMMHFDFNYSGANSYEQALQTMRRLCLSMEEIEQQVLRTFFNVLARNQDDHVKNIAFLMNKNGEWCLSPAFDVVYSYNPSGLTRQHQMSIGGKRDGFKLDDLFSFAGVGGLKKARAKRLLGKVSAAVGNWRHFAKEADVLQENVVKIERAHRSELFI